MILPKANLNSSQYVSGSTVSAVCPPVTLLTAPSAALISAGNVEIYVYIYIFFSPDVS